MLCRPRCRLALSLCSRCAVRHHGLQRRLATAAGAAPPSSLDAYHRSSTPIPGWSSSSSSAADPPASYRSPTLPRAGDVAAHGIPGLLKPAHFGTAWTDYHQLLMDSLNADTADAPYLQGMKLDSLIAATARQPDKAHIFNAASMAYNNHFFFRNLATLEPCPPSNVLGGDIVLNFSSLDTLRLELLDTADAMFGPGYVWLVEFASAGAQSQAHPRLRVLATYIAGSPLASAHWRRQPADLNSRGPTNSVGAFGNYSSGPSAGSVHRPSLGGIEVNPLLCVSTWQHVWLPQYGIRGKRDYLERWWNRINWNDVEKMTIGRPKKPGQ